MNWNKLFNKIQILFVGTQKKNICETDGNEDHDRDLYLLSWEFSSIKME